MKHAKTLVLGDFGTFEIDRKGHMNLMAIVHQGNIVRKKKGLEEISRDDVLSSIDLREFLLASSKVGTDNGDNDVCKAFPDLFKRTKKGVLTVRQSVGMKIASSMDVGLEAFLISIYASQLMNCQLVYK